MKQAGPTIGACVVSHNSGQHLQACLRNLLNALKHWYPSLIVVIDNDSEVRPEVEVLEERCPVLLIYNRTNRGYGAACNQGASILLRAGCRYLAFLNPDVYVTEETIRAVLKTLEGNPTLGCVGGLAVGLSAGGQRPWGARTRPTFLQKLVLYGSLSKFARSLAARHFLTADRLVDGQVVYAVSGALLVFRSEAFSAIGGFDERLFLFEEEFAIAERMVRAGWHVGFSMAEYYHDGGHSLRRLPVRARLAFLRSEQYLAKAYYRWPPLLRLALCVWRLLEVAVAAIRRGVGYATGGAIIPESPVEYYHPLTSVIGGTDSETEEVPRSIEGGRK